MTFAESAAIATPAPVKEKDRILSLDVLRGFALLGILPMNIQAFSMIGAAYLNPTAYGDLRGVNFWVWYVSHLLADQKFMTIFSMLFGAGILLMTGRVEASGRKSALLHYRRMAWLILFGLLHGYLLWSGDILMTYGICGMFAYPFRKLSPRRLILIGLAFIAVTTLVFVGAGISLPYWPHGRAEALNLELWQPSSAMVQHEVAAYRSGWLGEMAQRFSDNTTEQINGLIFMSFWRVEGLMLVGMALFRLGVLSARSSPRVYWAFIGSAIAVGLPLIAYGTHLDFAGGWRMRESLFFHYQYNYWASILVSLGWIGAIMLACQSARIGRFTSPFAAVGRTAFSNYILDTLICTAMFYGFGLGYFGKVNRVHQIEIVVVIWAIQLLLSPIWLRFFLFGPLEWLWRSLTYWEWEPFVRKTPTARVAAASEM